MSLIGTLSLKDLNLTGTLLNPDEISGNMNKGINAAGNISNVYYRGYSAYDIAVQHGFIGTEEEWLATLDVNYATDVLPGIMKLYDCTGENIDGAMTQRSVSHAIEDNSANSISADDLLQILV